MAWIMTKNIVIFRLLAKLAYKTNTPRFKKVIVSDHFFLWLKFAFHLSNRTKTLHAVALFDYFPWDFSAKINLKHDVKHKQR